MSIASEEIASIFIRRGLAQDLADALAERIEIRPDLADRVRAGDRTLRAAPMSGNWPEDDGDPNEVIAATAQTKSGSAAVLIEKLSPEQMRELKELVRAP